MEYDYIELYKKPLLHETFLTKYIKSFYKYAIDNYELDDKTLYIYIRNLEQFEKFIKFEFKDIKSITEIEEEHIERYKDFCINGLKNREKSVNGKLTALRYLFSYLADEEVIRYNIALNIKKYRIEAKEYPDIFKTGELKRLFDAMREARYGLRDIVISKLILLTGLEVAEIVNLTIDNIDIENKLVLLNGKTYPLGNEILKDLRDYLLVRRELNIKESVSLFLNQKGLAYSIRSYQIFFKQCVIKADIPKRLSPRHLKTTFLYNMAKVLREEELKKVVDQTKIDHYYKLLENPLQNLI